MSTLLKLMYVVVLMACIQVDERPGPNPEIWNRIRSFGEENPSIRNPELVRYLQSLTPEEVLGAARAACEEGAADARLPSDELRLNVAVSNALVCLEYCLDNPNADGVARMLLERAGDPREHPWLRYAIVECTHGFSRHRFGTGLCAYTLAHGDEVHALLSDMLKAGEEDRYLRASTVTSLAAVLREQFWVTCQSDPNVRRALKESPAKGSEFLQVMKLVKSGDVDLDERTWETVKPVLSKIVDSIKLLGSIAADRENEPEGVREEAKRGLKGYKMLRSPDLDEKIDEALQPSGD